MKQISLKLPYHPSDYTELTPGTKLLLSGTIYTARDQAHRRLLELIRTNQTLPFDLADTAFFYCGPSPCAPGQICGAVGPTTSYRMDPFVPELLNAGLKLMIGKGERSPAVEACIREHRALYLVAIGGISAVLSQHIVSCETFLWEDLGAEAVFKLQVRDFPCYISIC